MNIPTQWQSLKSTAAWGQFRELLDTAVETLLAEARDELEVADAYKVVLRSVAVASEVVLDPSADNPVFIRMDTPSRNVGGDNPDGEYDVTVIDGSRDYRIYGNKGDISYFGFQVLGGQGMEPRHHVTYLKDADLQIDSEGNFEFVLSTEDPQDGRQWLPITPQSSAIVVRQYIADRAAESLPNYHIEPLNTCDSYRPPTDDDVAEKLIATAWTMVKLALIYRDIPEVLDKPNQMTMLSSAQAGAADTTPDNTYMIGVYELQPDEVLIIELMPPQTRYWNLTIENYWHECIDYLHRPVSATNKQVKTRADGSVRFVLSEKEPANLSADDNWLSNSSRRRGFMILRWLDTPSAVKLPDFRVQRMSEEGSLVFG